MSDTRNLIADYYDRLPAAIARCVGDPEPDSTPARFSPGFALPELDDPVRRFYDVADATWRELGEHRGHRLSMLDLTANPATNTTKTIASLLIVARAVDYVRRTGEQLLIFSPTSANKGVALRDALARAIETELVTPDQLRVVTLAPRTALGKFRASRLSTDPDLCRRNPVLTYDGPRAEHVKTLGRAFVDRHAAKLAEVGTRTWFTLELHNYRFADAARAFFEHEVAPANTPRWHAHAVSSAFGLLGYATGLDVLGDVPRPGYLLVQHLGTPDMVLSLRHGDFDRARVPAYVLDPATGLHRQDRDAHFPEAAHDPAEILDQTFYTREPATSPEMNGLIERCGGDGIVVSLHECLTRYARLRAWLEPAGVHLPADPRLVREWSLVMALTGVLNAIDRGLVPADRDVVVHGSGFYAATDYEPIGADAVVPVATVDDIAAAIVAD
ncbi:DUF6002 family protein [Actinophytocola sp.]|uniref:DUF6002 family protein n=1 Tax=Actinophytocola sp. TaxID=1872138 RepID=UPI003D6B33E4